MANKKRDKEKHLQASNMLFQTNPTMSKVKISTIVTPLHCLSLCLGVLLAPLFIQTVACAQGNNNITVNGTTKREYRNNGSIEMFSGSATATEPQYGTGPASGSKVSAGQNLTFQIALDDLDERRLPGGEWEEFMPDSSWGAFSVQLTLTNAKFTGSTDTQKTFTANRYDDAYAAFNIGITVDSPWMGDVNLAIQVTDNIIIPADSLATGVVATACQDPVWSGNISWQKATVFPTSATVDKQDPGTIGEEQTTNHLMQWYLYGPDLNGAINPAPNYEGTTVEERFGKRTSNLIKEWLHPDLVAENPTWTDQQWRDYIFSDEASNIRHTTFTIGPDDHTYDGHKGNIYLGRDDDALSTIGKTQTIYVDLPQWYETPPGTSIANFTIRRKRTGAADGTATYQIRKW